MYKELIKDFQNDFWHKIIKERNISFPFEILHINKIITFIGPRRAGKTYFMFSVIRELIHRGEISLSQVVFLDFSSLFIQGFDVQRLLQDFYELHPWREPFFIFDEIQELKDFSQSVLFLFNKWYKIFLSGSNSTLLSSELSTVFRGRTYDITVLPLSFEEFLIFHALPDTQSIHTAQEVWVIKNAMQKYMRFWAYPELCFIENEAIKLDIIKNYFEVLLYRDMLERYGIENEYVLKYLFRKIVINNSKEFSFTKVFHELKSQNIKVWIQSLYNYLEYFQDIFFVRNISDRYRKIGKKFYLYDVGFTNLIEKNNFWQRFENIIFLSLLRNFGDITYLKREDAEIDFIVESKNLAVQVCYSLNTENQERETKILRESDFLHKILVYYDKEKDFEISWFRIMSFWEFERFLREV